MGAGHFLFNVFSIILIDLLLAGDNALVIAMAVRSLPQRQRRVATIFGAAGAVTLRVALTALAARLLTLRYVQLAGGLLILWIALKVLRDASDPPDAAPAPRRMAQAIWYIMAADLTMSLDNILAIAGASRGHVGLIVFGLGLSIPFVIFAANLLASLMDRYPTLIYLGAAILGKVGGEMILTDPFTKALLHPSPWLCYGVEAALAVAVVITGRTIAAARARKPAP
ncbi:MAG: TerC family protein [Bryobacteraceae bacterium]|jgi:YjbE family integral membrane protein